MYSIMKTRPSNYANNIIRRICHKLLDMASSKYEEAVNCINELQSNSSYIQNIDAFKHSPTYSTTIVKTQKYLQRSGVTLEQLDKLPVIHVSGTKGKGSTCAFCESILRHHGYKTGLYTSPHLISIKERIRINGKPVSEDIFSDNVISIYNKLLSQKEDEDDMPLYFRFLTIVAFNIFLQENVDVAIIEVGIGGECDCTNILRKTQVVGITSLGMDHIQMLGSTIEKIAWQKAGIMKAQAQGFTVPQPASALNVIQERAFEKHCSINLVPVFEDYKWESNDIPTFNDDVQKINASLAIQLSHTWMTKHGRKNDHKNLNSLFVPEATKIGIQNCKWPGRFQILKYNNATIFLDGAHTEESLKKCIEWFENNSNSSCKVLLFNMIGKRDSRKLLNVLSTVKFTNVIFLPNIAYRNRNLKEQEDLLNDISIQISRCEKHHEIWRELAQLPEDSVQRVSVLSSVEEAMSALAQLPECDILVTGSLHLVGAALTLLDPDLKTF